MLLLCLAGFTSVASAQVEQGWYVNVDLLRLSTSGNKVGDIFVYHESFFETPDVTLLNNYGVDYKPLVVQPTANLAYMFDVGYRKGRWGVGVQGWKTTFRGALEGRVTSSDFAMTPTSVEVRGVRILDQSIRPLMNDLEASGVSPIDYHFFDTTKVWKVDLLLQRNLVSSKHLQLGLNLGVAVGYLENSRVDGEAQHAHQEITVRAQGPNGPATIQGTTVFDNKVSFEGVGDSWTTWVGPVAGVTAVYTFGRLEVGGQVASTLFFGKNQSQNIFTDDDHINLTMKMSNTIDTETVFLHGILQTSEEQRTTVPVLEIRGKVGVRITQHLSLGGGVFTSQWLSVPMAPSWSFPGQWTALGGTNSKPNVRNLSFMGYSFFVRASF